MNLPLFCAVTVRVTPAAKVLIIGVGGLGSDGGDGADGIILIYYGTEAENVSD